MTDERITGASYSCSDIRWDWARDPGGVKRLSSVPLSRSMRKYAELPPSSEYASVAFTPKSASLA